MFKPPATRALPQRSRSEETRRLVLDTALARFREQGFDATTMRDVAAAAGLSLGAAYYYFASKEAIVAAYYERVQDAHAARCQGAFADVDLRGRLGVALHTKIDIVQGDRALLRALFRYGGDPGHELSWFGPATRRQRDASIALFRDVLAGERLPKDLQDAGPALLWALHMGVLLFFLFDDSTNHRRTRRLIDGTVDLVVDLRRVVSSPLLRPLRRRIFGLLGDAGLLPSSAPAGG